jgi:hypothetical protein
MRVATVFVRLLRISGFLPSHVAGIEMILAIRIFARPLHIRVFVFIVGDKGVPSEGGATSNSTAAP